jgi:hypothetical protein
VPGADHGISNTPGAAKCRGKIQKHMKQQVTATSIASYRSLDHTTLRGRIAGWIVAQSNASPVFIRQIAEYFDLDKSSASARLNELKQGVFSWNGQHYRLEFAKKVFDQKTCKTVDAWKAVPAHDPGSQTNLF